MAIQIKDKDMGFDKLINDLRNIRSQEVVVGLFDSTGSDDADYNVAYRGYVNEYGVSGDTNYTTIPVPPRPFMRETYTNNIEKIKKLENKLLGRLIDGKISASVFYNSVGTYIKDLIKNSITNGSWTPNTDRTIKSKGSSRPLIDSGEMRNSVTYKVRKRGGS